MIYINHIAFERMDIERQRDVSCMRGDELYQYVKDNFRNDYSLIAAIDTENLEDAYERSNTVFRPWSDGPGVVLFTMKGVRSSSVGDVFVHNGKMYVVDSCGFKEVTC